MKFYTQFERPSLDECPYEAHPDEGKVETAGYIPTEIMINRFLEAGERLAVSNAGYEFADGKDVPEDYKPLPLIGNLDAMYLDKMVSARLQAQEDFAKSQAAKVVVPPVDAKIPAAP